MSKKDPSVESKYKAHSDLLVKLKKKAELEYDRQKFAEFGHDKSKTWRYVNEIMKRKKKKTTSIKSIRNKKGECIRKTKMIANCLNNHFSSIGKDMSAVHVSNSRNPLDYIAKRVEENMSFTDTDSSEILEIILSQDDKKSCGYDEINNKIIKNTSTVAAPF